MKVVFWPFTNHRQRPLAFDLRRFPDHTASRIAITEGTLDGRVLANYELFYRRFVNASILAGMCFSRFKNTGDPLDAIRMRREATASVGYKELSKMALCTHPFSEARNED